MMDVALLIKFIVVATWEFGRVKQALHVYEMQHNDNYIT